MRAAKVVAQGELVISLLGKLNTNCLLSKLNTMCLVNSTHKRECCGEGRKSRVGSTVTGPAVVNSGAFYFPRSLKITKVRNQNKFTEVPPSSFHPSSIPPPIHDCGAEGGALV